MADLLIRDLDDATRAELKARAAQHGRSLSAEARAILQAKMAEAEAAPFPPPIKGLGTLMLENAARLTDEDRQAFREVLAEVRNRPERPPIDFGE